MSVENVTDRLELEESEVQETFFANGWTDGLPVVLPTRRRVEAVIEHVGRDPQESLGPVPPRGGEATIEKLAINAVMGGCRPEHVPVVLAAMEALLDPVHNLNGVSQTTHMCVSLAIVNGPIARELGFNSRDGVSFVVPSGCRTWATVSCRARRNASACALPRPSAIASAKLPNSTVNHKKSTTRPVNRLSAPLDLGASRTNSSVVQILPT